MDGILYVNKDELIKLVKEDDYLSRVDVELARTWRKYQNHTS